MKKEVAHNSGWVIKFANFLRRMFGLKSRTQTNNKQYLEVLDVIIRSKCRLQMFHLNSGRDYLMNPQFSDYQQKMVDKLES